MKKFFSIFLFITLGLSGQNSLNDSIENILNSRLHDSDKMKQFLEIGWDLVNLSRFDDAITFLNEAEKIAKKQHFTKHLGRAYGMKGVAYRMQGKFKDAIDYLSQALKIAEETGNLTAQATSLGNLGIIYESQKNIKKAFEYYEKALTIRTQIGDKVGMLYSYNDIAILFDVQRDYKNAITYFYKALELGQELGDSSKIALCYGSLGGIYLSWREFDKAKSFEIKALDIYTRLNEGEGLCRTYACLGEIEKYSKNFKESIRYFEKSKEIAEQLNIKEMQKDDALGLAGAYFAIGDYKRAFEYQSDYITIKDSILNNETARQMAEMNSKYETEKKDKVIALQNSESEKQHLIKNAFIIGFGVLLILAAFIFRGYTQKKKDNKIIAAQKAIVEEKQKEILDSIQYAKRIQTALMSNENYIEKNLARLQAKKPSS